MNAPLHVGFVALARPTFDTALAAEVTAQARAALLGTGALSLVGPENLMLDLSAAEAAAQALATGPLDLLVIFQASFADSTMAVALARAVPAPVLLWAVPEERTGGRLRLNSFCGINLAGHSLHRAGFRYDYVYAAPGDPAAAAKTLTLARAGRAARLLRSARIGRFGRNPDGFEPCTFDDQALTALTGVRVEQRGLAEVFDSARAAADTVAPALADLSRHVEGLAGLDQTALHKSLGAYVTLRDLAQENAYAGLAVRCWPEFFTELGGAACGAMSMLSDQLIPCSCEADVNGTVTQLMLQWLSGEPAFGTDMVGFDVARNEAVLWHCGLAPLAMADPEFRPRGTIHSNRKLPLLMEFPLKPGRVTIARLTQAGDGAYRLVVGRGEMLRAPLSFSGTSGVLRFDRPAGEVLDTIMAEGLDHHISLTYGDHLDALLALARLLDLPVLRLA